MPSLSKTEFILILFLDLIYHDGKCTKNEEILVEQIVSGHKISIVAFRTLKNAFESKYGNYSNNNYSSENNNQKKTKSDFGGKISLDEAYTILRCSKEDSFETIKKSYRKMVSQYHMDRLNSKDLPSELLKIAEEMMKKINIAYETIKISRGM